MSDWPRLAEVLPPTNEPLRIAIRRLSWFRQAFHRFAAASGRAMGCHFAIDEEKLAAAFLRWLDAIDAQRPASREHRRDYFEFAAALMLRELVVDLPIRPQGPPEKMAPDSAAAFWPEGYCCTTFCLCLHSAAMAQEFSAPTQLDPSFADLRQWWSFRENAQVDHAFSAGFFQRLLGKEPNWILPDVFSARIRSELGHQDQDFGNGAS